jgi:hypothetical protein
VRPPDLATVVARALATSVLLTRAQIEDQLARERERAPSWTSALERLEGWIASEGLDAALTDEERALLALPWGGFSADDTQAAIWRIEGLAALLFALGKLDALPFEHEVEADAVHAALPLFATRELLTRGATLREAAELDRLRRAAGVWRWRAKTELMHRKGVAPSSGETYEAMLARAMGAGHQAGLIALCEGDLACRGGSFRELSSEALRAIATIALERGRAADWLAGRALWDARAAL